MKRKVLLIVFIMITLIILVLATLVPFLSNKNIKKNEELYNEIIKKIEDASKKYFYDNNIDDLNTIYNYDILFLLDTSSTMNGIGSNDDYRLLNSINSINRIMQTYSNYKYSIVTFNKNVETVLKLDKYTKTSDVFIKAIKNNNVYEKYSIGNYVYDSKDKKVVPKKYSTGNGSDLLKGINTSIDDYLNSKSSNTPLMFIITDGDIESDYDVYKNKIDEIRDKVYKVNKKNLGIYVISFDIKNEIEQQIFYLSDSSNNKTFYTVEDITGIIKNNIDNRRDSYIISVDELIDLGYLNSNDLVDSKNNKKINGKVIISSVLKDNDSIACKKSDDDNYCEYIFNFFN